MKVLFKDMIANAGRRAFGRVRRMGADESGATAVELAFIAAPFFGLLFAIFETAAIFFNQEALENTTSLAARQLLVGQIQLSSASAADQKTALQNLICPLTGTRPSSALPANFDCSKVIIDVRALSSFTGAATTVITDPTTAVFQPGAAGQVNVVRVVYPYPIYLSYISGFGGTEKLTRYAASQYNGTWVTFIMGISVFKVEPYSS